MPKYLTHQKKNLCNKKGIYPKEDTSVLELDSEKSSENESGKYLLIAFKTNSKK